MARIHYRLWIDTGQEILATAQFAGVANLTPALSRKTPSDQVNGKPATSSGKYRKMRFSGATSS
jgi:hypothetical protein